MPYMEQMQSTLKGLVAAAEAGRTSLDGMLGPLNGAVSDMTGAASELENVPFIGPEIGAKVQRTLRQINAAQTMVGTVAAKYGQAVSAATQVQQRMGSLKEQAGKAGAAINRIAGKVSPALSNILPSSSLLGDATPAAEAVKPFPHLLIIQPLKPNAQLYRGRGLIQVTGRANYEACSEALFGDSRLLNTPELLEQPVYASLSAGWFWHREGLNSLADKGDILAITKRINGGTNGLEDRKAIYTRALEVLQ